MELDKEEKDFVIEKAAKGYEADEIEFLMQEEGDLPMSPSEKSIQEFLDTDEAEEQVEIRKSIRDKKSEISKEDLVETLVDLKDDLEEWQTELKALSRNPEQGAVRNDAIKNVISTVNKIGELIGELNKGGASGDNIVKIDQVNNYVKKEFTQVVKHLPKDQKQNIVEQLEKDPEIEDFVIQRKTSNE